MRKPPQTPGQLVRIHIERVVLEGVGWEPDGALRLQQAVAAELERLWQEQPASQESHEGQEGRGQQRCIDGGAVTFTPGNGPEALGRQVARALHRQLRATSASARWSPAAASSASASLSGVPSSPSSASVLAPSAAGEVPS